MPASSRKQYTSCDHCRKSRLGCDAAIRRGGSCSNCLRRSKTCGFEWIEKGRNAQRTSYVPARNASDTPPFERPRANTSCEVAVISEEQVWQESVPHSNNYLSSSNEDISSRRQQALTLHHVLWDIFTSLFEPQLGLWIGNDCNPFKRLTTAPKTLVSRLMVTLDNSTRNPLPPETARKLGIRETALDDQGRVEEDAFINQALMSAVHAFAARWLSISHFRKPGETSTRDSIVMKECFVESLWQRAHNDVLPILTRPSYRSILALYLFGITPTSLGNKDRSASDLCLETSLRHYIKLRAEARITTHRILSESVPTAVDAHINVAETAALKSQEEYSHLADTAYWFGIYGSACKTLFWKAISRVQDYFVYQTTDLSLDQVMANVIGAMNQFEDVFGSLLDQCARDYLLLTEKSRISYFLLSFHFHMGVLILVDTLDVQQELSHTDTQFDIVGARMSSVRAIVNLINLTLQTDVYANDSSTSILLRDPYPEHISNGLSRAAHSILSLFHSMMLPSHTAEVMASSLFSGLEILSQISYTAAGSLTALHPLYADAKLAIKCRQSAPSCYLSTTASVTTESPVTPELFEEETVRELGLASGDPSLVNKTIKRHEMLELPQDQVWDYLPWVDFGSVTQDWGFEVCRIFTLHRSILKNNF
ncbi:hypothetical protein VE03_02576 [Pseudogymnoascus sp. 23342-1-I1]|nr:hypothetical protein VE03_02576 [Pseudogymnoascus sp. 23342-1-I1]